jgi:hypothetical protein
MDTTTIIVIVVAVATAIIIWWLMRGSSVDDRSFSSMKFSGPATARKGADSGSVFASPEAEEAAPAGASLDASDKPDPVTKAPVPIVVEAEETPQPSVEKPSQRSKKKRGKPAPPQPAAPKPAVVAPPILAEPPAAPEPVDEPVAAEPFTLDEPVVMVEPEPVVSFEPPPAAPEPAVETPEPTVEVPAPVEETPAPALEISAPEPVVEAPEPIAEAPAPTPIPEPAAQIEEAPVAAPPPAPEPVVAAPTSPTAELEETDKRHKDARRLARLLVSEIKLYNESAVTQGRAKNDLYTRLKKDIDRSTDVYVQRVPEEVRTQFDYLHDELVRQLAEGDASRLGPDAPPPNPPR